MIIATIGKIVSLLSIPDADRIEAAVVICGKAGRWSGVIVKGIFQEGDLAEVYLQDCIVPAADPRFEFMSKHRFIVKMARFRGTPSECLILPISESTRGITEIGADIASLMGCVKYEKPLPANMAGDALGNFPGFILKTDELNFQTARHLVDALVGKPYYITEKADGSSATCYKYEGHFGCCSRNLELKDTPNNTIWQIARKYDLANLLSEGFAIQFECVGPGIQSNPMGLKQVEPRLFNLYSIQARRYLCEIDLRMQAQALNMPLVGFVQSGDSFPAYTDDELRKLAEGLYPNGKQREGIVIRPLTETQVMGERLSFKVINLLYSK